MGNQHGDNRVGLAGTFIALPGVNAKFHGDAIRWNLRKGTQVKLRRGYGTDQSVEAKYRHLYCDGGGVLAVRTLVGDWPVPDSIDGQEGSIVYIVDRVGGTDRKITVPILVTGYEPSFATNKENADEPIALINYVTTGAAVFTGWAGTQPGATVPTRSDLSLYDGTFFAKDPNGLQSSAQVTVDWWESTSNTTAATISKLDSAITSYLAPFTGMKLRSMSIARDAFDGGGSIVYQCGLTDTQEDVENPATVRTVDANFLGRAATVCLVLGTNAPGTAPTISGYIFRTSTWREINDNKFEHTYYYGVKDTLQDVKFPGTITFDDASDLADEATITLVQASATPTPPSLPSGMKLDDTATEQLTDTGAGGEYKHTFTYRRRTRQEATEYDGSPTNRDGSDLGDTYSTTLVRANSTYSAPAAADGYVFLDALIIQRHAASTGAKWIHTYKYGRVSNLKAREFAGTMLVNQSTENFNDTKRQIGDVSTIRFVTASGTPPTEPDPSSYGVQGLAGKVIKCETVQITTAQGAYTGYWQHTFIVAPNDQYDELVNEGVFADDPSNFGDEETIRDTATSSTFPATPTPSNTDLQLVYMSRRRVNAASGIWAFTWKFARMTEKDTRQLKRRTEDPDDFGETESIPLVATSRTASPGTPSQIGTASNLVETEVVDLVTANGSFTGLFLWTFKFGPTTRKQEIELEGEIDTDVSLLSGQDVQTKTGTSSTFASDPATRITGMVIVKRRAVKLQDTPQKWKYLYYFAYRTNTQAVEMDGSENRIDPSAIGGLKTVMKVEATEGSAGTAPAAPTGMVFYEVVTKQEHGASIGSKWKNAYVYAYRTREDEEEFGASKVQTDPSGLDSETAIAVLQATNTPPSTPSGLVLYDTMSKQRTATLYLFVYVYRLRTRQTEIENAGTAWEATPMLPKRQSVTTIVSSGLAGDAYRDSIYGANKSDVLFDELIVRPEVPGKFRQTLTTVANTKEIIPGGGDTFLDFLAAEPDPVTGGYGLNPVRIKITVFDAFLLVDHYVYNSVRVRPIPRYRTQTKFTLRRRFVTADPYSKLLHSQWGTVNTAAFLNFAAHEVRLNCATFRQDLSDAAAHLAVIDYDLASDSMFWFSYGNCNLGREPCMVQPVYPVTLYINPASFINAGWVAIWHAASDFSTLTA